MARLNERFQAHRLHSRLIKLEGIAERADRARMPETRFRARQLGTIIGRRILNDLAASI